MMENTELINGLRWCADESICCDDFSGEKCPYFDEKKDSCSVDEILHAAADAIEASEKRIEELKKGYSWKAYAALEESIEGYKTRIAELEAQMQKQDKWMKKSRWDYQQPSQSATINTASQSATINVGTTFLCRSTGKLCSNATQYGYCKQTVCNN